MDSSKLKALQDAAWQPAACCGSCAFGKFQAAQLWGLCGLSKNDYHHNKHQRRHQLPAHVNAVCRWYEGGPAREEIQTFLASKVTS